MHFPPSVEEFVVNGNATRPHMHCRIGNVQVIHNTAAKLLVLRYSVEVIRQEHEDVTPYLYTLPGSNDSVFELMLREKLLSEDFLLPKDNLDGLKKSSLPNVLVDDFLKRVLSGRYDQMKVNIQTVPKNTMVPKEGDVFIPKFIFATYKYIPDHQTLSWIDGKVEYSHVGSSGKVGMTLSFDEFNLVVTSNKLQPVALDL